MIHTSMSQNTATISLQGYFHFESHREFSAAYKKPLSSSNISHIVVNLSGIEYLDSSALGMLLLLQHNAKEEKKTLVLSSPSPFTQRIFDVVGFDKLFTITA